ncbi:MAG TPA: hypothetical protein VFY29_05830 [Terriglobia bacterium]|nr:hypothetical protein [Terriglobia bacterium]
MRNQFSKTAVLAALAVACAAGAAFGQGRGPGGPGGPGGAGGFGGPGGPGGGAAAGNVAIANPTYVSLVMEVTVNKPAEEVWKRVGKYCDIGEWMQVQCAITSGKDGEIGAVRSIGREILVGKTDLSYTYTQPVTEGRPYILYHGTLEAKPLTATTSKLVYTLMWDNSTQPDDAAKDRDKEQRRTMFQRALDNMKILAEGGTLPAGGRGGAGGPGGGRGGPGGPGGAGGRGGAGGPGGGAGGFGGGAGGFGGGAGGFGGGRGAGGGAPGGGR